MIDTVTPYRHSADPDYRLSILIPTWNNLPYLKLCLESIRQHTTVPWQAIVFVNEGSDGTLDWLISHAGENLDYLHSPRNVGICYGVNLCRTLVKSDHLVFMNDDMYVLPGWDLGIMKIISRLDTKLFMISATLIEPEESGNRCVIVRDYGRTMNDFDKTRLITDAGSLKRKDWQGSTWPPVALHREAWDLVGGFSTEFTPGLYSDPDLAFKMYRAGAREFIGSGSSLVYHFGSKTTGRVIRNRGHLQFLNKWGISAKTFRREILRMGEPYRGPLPDPGPRMGNRITDRLKRIYYRL